MIIEVIRGRRAEKRDDGCLRVARLSHDDDESIMKRSLAVCLGSAWILLATVLAAGSLGADGHSFSRILYASPAPFSWPRLGPAVAGHGLALGGLIVLLVGVFGAGRAVAGLTGIQGTGAGLAALASGWGVVSLIQHGLGLAGLEFPVVLYGAAALVIAGAAGLVSDRPWRGFRAGSGSERLALCGTAILLAGSFLLSRLPEVTEDARQGHYAMPEQYLMLHKITAEPGNMGWQMPRGAEMTNMIPWRIGGVEGGKLANVGYLVTLVLLAAAVGRLLGMNASEGCPAPADRLPEGDRDPASPSAGWWGAMLAAACGMAMEEVWEGKNDLGMAAGAVGAVWCVLRASDPVGGCSPPSARTASASPATGGTESGRWWLLAGWLLGCAMGVKYTAGFFAVGTLAAAWMAGMRIGSRGAVLATAIFLVPFAGWMADGT